MSRHINKYLNLISALRLFRTIRHDNDSSGSFSGAISAGFGLFILILLANAPAAFAQTTQQFTASGTFTVPVNVNKLTVEAWGGGGAGGGTFFAQPAITTTISSAAVESMTERRSFISEFSCDSWRLDSEWSLRPDRSRVNQGVT